MGLADPYHTHTPNTANKNTVTAKLFYQQISASPTEQVSRNYPYSRSLARLNKPLAIKIT